MTWWTTNYHVCYRDFRLPISEDVNDVTDSAVIAEICVVRLSSVCVEIVCPYGLEIVAEKMRKPC